MEIMQLRMQQSQTMGGNLPKVNMEKRSTEHDNVCVDRHRQSKFTNMQQDAFVEGRHNKMFSAVVILEKLKVSRCSFFLHYTVVLSS
jgi:hypothetical protein